MSWKLLFPLMSSYPTIESCCTTAFSLYAYMGLKIYNTFRNCSEHQSHRKFRVRFISKLWTGYVVFPEILNSYKNNNTSLLLTHCYPKASSRTEKVSIDHHPCSRWIGDFWLILIYSPGFFTMFSFPMSKINLERIIMLTFCWYIFLVY